MTDPIEQIRRTLAGPNDDEHRTDLWERVELEIRELPAPTHTPTRLRSFRLAAAIVVAACLGFAGVAAANSASVRSWLGIGAASEVDTFASEDPEATAAEYEALRRLVLVPRAKSTGTFDDDTLVAKYRLAPRDHAKVIVDDPRVGRVVAVPTIDEGAICYLYKPTSTASGSGGCGLQFDATGLMPEYSFGGTQQSPNFTISGLAADDVSQITISLKSGKTIHPDHVGNAFRWSGSGTDATPIAITTVRTDGKHTVAAMTPVW